MTRHAGARVTQAQRIKAALERVPLLTIPETAAALNAEPRAHGFYAWWLLDREALPEVPATPHASEPVGLLYIGIGPGRRMSVKRTLRDRFKDHTRRNTGNSTFRLDLASFLFERESWSPVWTDRAMLTKTDNDALSAWQANNLRVQWVEVPEPWRLEVSVIKLMRPPLNRDHNEAHPFYHDVGRARERYRAAARANTRV